MTGEVNITGFDVLRQATQARIGLGRVGHAEPTSASLSFQMDHARARDAVHAELDNELLHGQMADETPVKVFSRASDRNIFLQRPDLGRRLDEASLQELSSSGYDVVFVLADGLSANAVHAHAVKVVSAVRRRLPGWTIGPPVIAHQARVALGDEIGEKLGAELVVVLIGERPGLSAADSLGAYLTWKPRVGRADSERNCVSNIRPPHGLGYDAASELIAWLLAEARRLQLTGVKLKDIRRAKKCLPGQDGVDRN